MANTQIKVPLFAAAEVLSAANMNISAGTGIPVFATTVTRDAAFGGAGEKVLAEGSSHISKRQMNCSIMTVRFGQKFQVVLLLTVIKTFSQTQYSDNKGQQWQLSVRDF
jgi:hypothetical protein